MLAFITEITFSFLIAFLASIYFLPWMQAALLAATVTVVMTLASLLIGYFMEPAQARGM